MFKLKLNISIIIVIILFTSRIIDGYQILPQVNKSPIIKSLDHEKSLKINKQFNNEIHSSIKSNKVLVPTALVLFNLLLPFDIHAANAITTLPVISPGVDVNWRYFLSGAICCSFSHGISVPCKLS